MTEREHTNSRPLGVLLAAKGVPEQDVKLALEVSLLKERVKVLEETLLAQEATIERLKRLVGCLR